MIQLAKATCDHIMTTGRAVAYLNGELVGAVHEARAGGEHLGYVIQYLSSKDEYGLHYWKDKHGNALLVKKSGEVRIELDPDIVGSDEDIVELFTPDPDRRFSIFEDGVRKIDFKVLRDEVIQHEVWIAREGVTGYVIRPALIADAIEGTDETPPPREGASPRIYRTDRHENSVLVRRNGHVRFIT